MNHVHYIYIDIGSGNRHIFILFELIIIRPHGVIHSVSVFFHFHCVELRYVYFQAEYMDLYLE